MRIFLFIFLFVFFGCENTVNSKKQVNDDSVEVDEELDDTQFLDENVQSPDESDVVPDEAVDENEKNDVDFIWDNCSEHYDCNGDEMCVKETGRCNDAWGHCEKIPVECNDIDDPVCGCDGISYSNLCEARRHTKNIFHTGLCE